MTPTWLEAPLSLARLATRALDALQPVALLAARLYVGAAFFRSGLTKIADWETTLALFQDEYKVPLLSPHVAALMGTGGELVLPVLLVLGLFGRFGALGLSVVNVIAVLSLEEIAPAALAQHELWGCLLAAVVLWGPGKLAVDAWLWPKLSGGAGPAMGATARSRAA
ncbi:DoxX family protein [uncultured Methylibium sp.]|uniref:DoxX family protein n=1 Tax=uncultured Methylibium sp. TaxID=381093 RepID=UPI0025F75478|nr:DoxX family protein [uncultured Methylibium sp.]